MIIEFDKDYLRELYTDGRTGDKKHRYQPEVVRGYQKAVFLLSSANSVTDLFRNNALNYEVLKGDKKGISSVRINRQYRLEFTVREILGEQIVTVCRLLDISNHYKSFNMETKKTYAPHEIQPSTPIHPGEILKDELEARGMSQRKFAAVIGVSYSVLNEVINGKRPVTTEYALKIEAATGIPAYIWVNMQSAYNMQTARKDSKLSVILDNIRKSVAVL